MTTNAAYPMVGMNGAGIRVPTNSMVGMNGAGIRRITNAPYGTASYNPYGPGGPSMRTTNAVYGFNNQVVDDNKSSGLALGPQPFRMR